MKVSHPILPAGLLSIVSMGVLWAAPSPTAQTAPQAASDSHAQIKVEATVTQERYVNLSWVDSGKGALGYRVEWTSDLGREFTALDFLPANARGYQHLIAMPGALQYYRVCALYGRASAAHRVTVSADISDADYQKRIENEHDYSWAGPAILPEYGPIQKFPLKDPRTADRAGPSLLRSAPVPATVSSFKITWIDQANDEDGFLLEVKRSDQTEYGIFALLDPNTNSYGYALSPPARSGLVRVLAYYFGPLSSVVTVNRGGEP
jgi:hypothetical protein